MLGIGLLETEVLGTGIWIGILKMVMLVIGLSKMNMLEINDSVGDTRTVGVVLDSEKK